MSLPVNEENQALKFNPTDGSLESVSILQPEKFQPTTLEALQLSEVDLQTILTKNFPTYTHNDPYNALSWIHQREFYGNKCILLRKEFVPFPAHIANGRIDICALDEQGRSVIVELKTKDTNTQLGQALCYAGLLSELDGHDFLKRFSEEKNTEIQEFLQKHNINISHVNHGQRIVLIAESFSAELLAGVELLNGMHDRTQDESLFVECIALTPFVNDEGTICLHFEPVKDPKIHNAITDHRKLILDCIEYTKNDAAKDFLQQHTEGEWNTADKVLYFRKLFVYTEPRTWKVRVRQKYLNILQLFYHRFDNDILFWKEFLSEPDFVVETKKGLSFRLVTAEDVTLFEECIKGSFSFLSKVRKFGKSIAQ